YKCTMGKMSKHAKLDDVEAYNNQIQEEKSLLRSMYYSLEEENDHLKSELQTKDEILERFQCGDKNKEIPSTSDIETMVDDCI
ncbi:hypothetical protein KI387_033638, partial [Taxus chinensis]